LEEGDWVVDAGKGRIEPKSSAEKAPLATVGSVGGSMAGMDASSNLVLAKVVDSPCCCAGVKWSIVQDVACGKARLKKEQICVSDRSLQREPASARSFFFSARNVVGAATWCYGATRSVGGESILRGLKYWCCPCVSTKWRSSCPIH
jgi:hypothetical protein